MMINITTARQASNLVSTKLDWRMAHSNLIMASPDNRYAYHIEVVLDYLKPVHLFITRVSGDDDEIRHVGDYYFYTVAAAASFASDDYEGLFQ